MPDAMVTARMSQGKKEAGTTVLDRLGVSPSKVINSLYDFIIEHNCLPQELTSNTNSMGNETISSERLMQARAWLAEISLPENNPFTSMSDDDIRRSRLAERGFDLPNEEANS